MAARIVYDGNVRGGGDLFKGITFHVLQRVPMRPTILQQIEANGGEITLVQKEADVVIADCARKDTPPGSISWKYIEQSVKKGELQELKDYPASKVPHQTNEAIAPASASPSKSRQVQPKRIGRTPFSHEDDRILLKFCALKERGGAQLKGNAIFQELEELNPRHTFHSWRDRWIKHLQYLPRPTLDEEEEEVELTVPVRSTPRSKAPKPISKQAQLEPARPIPKPSVAKPTANHAKLAPSRTMTRPTSAITVVETRHSDTKEAKETRPYLETSAGGNNFTEEETQLLLDAYDHILNVDEDHIIDAWIAWAAEYPSHTPQEWRNYFNKEVRENLRPSKQVKREAQPISPSTSSRQSAQRDAKGKRKAREDNDVPVPSSREVKDSQGSPSRTIESPSATKKTADMIMTEEETFKDNLLSTAQTLMPQLYEEGIDFDPIIFGTVVPLFDIWRAVSSNNFQGLVDINEQRKWPEVARILGFGKSQWKNAGQELQKCCNELFAAFEEALEAFNEVTESQAEEMLDNQLQQTAIEAAQRPQSSDDNEPLGDGHDEEENDDDLGAPQSSPFVTVSAKRVSPNTTTPASKRQKVDRGKGRARNISEIPSTPENVINSHQRRSPIKSSPLKKAPAQLEELSEEDESPLFVPLRKSPRAKPAPKRRMSDPKTQDFHFQDIILEEEEQPEEEEEFLEVSPTPARKTQLPIHSTNQSSLSTNGPSQADSSTQSQTVSQKQNSLEEFIDSRRALGYELAHVLEALNTTSMTTGRIATEVMESLQQGKGIPENEPGVWTEKDDWDLKTYRKDRKAKGNKERYTKLVVKHGKKSIKERKKFFENMEDDD